MSGWSRDAEIWARFVAEIDERIRIIRRESGFDGRHERWETFSSPPEALTPRRPRAIGLVVAIPANVSRRDERGRYRRAS